MRIDRAKVVCFLAIAIWGSYLATLWPLPPEQYAALHMALEASSASSSSSSASEGSRQSVESKSTQQEQSPREFVDPAKQYKTDLWIDWVGGLLLLTFGVAAWTLILLRGSRWWWATFASTGLLWLTLAIFHTPTYEYFFDAWREGHSGLRLISWSMAAWALYFNFAMPVALMVVTFGAFSRSARSGFSAV